jgi:hypothetical protein
MGEVSLYRHTVTLPLTPYLLEKVKLKSEEVPTDIP